MRDLTGMILDIEFVNQEIGFIAGATSVNEQTARARILKTADGGKNWRVVYESDRAGDNDWKLAFPTVTTSYATIISYQAPDNDSRGYVVKTDDGGEHWQKIIVTSDREWIPYGLFLSTKIGDSSAVPREAMKLQTAAGPGRVLIWVLRSTNFAVEAYKIGHLSIFAIGKEVLKLGLP